MASPSVENVIVVPVTTTAEITVATPEEVQLSSPPLSGSFWILCHNTDGNSYRTADFDVSRTDARHLRQLIEHDCSFLKGKIVVTKIDSTYKDDSIGIEYEIFFEGMNGPVDQFRIVSSDDDPLEGTDIVYEQHEERAFGDSLKWDVIPSEYFFTKHGEP